MQTGPGRLFVGSTQSFLQDGLLSFLRGNHSIRYDAAQGPQPQLVQHLRASAVSSAFDPEAKALRFQLSTALQAGEDPVPSPPPHCPSQILPGPPQGPGLFIPGRLGHWGPCVLRVCPLCLAEENEVGCPEGFELDTQGEFCVGEHPAGTREASAWEGRRAGGPVSADHRTPPHPADRDECSGSPSPCAHSCRNVPGRFSCFCPAGFTLAGDERTCRGEWAPGGEARLGPGPGVLREIPGLGPWPGAHPSGHANLGVPMPCSR